MLLLLLFLLVTLGPKIGYYPNPSKSWLIIKRECADLTNVFDGSSVKITHEGQKHLGAMIGEVKFKEKYVADKVEKWVKELKTLSKIAETQPQAAYVAFIVGYRQKFNYIFRTMNNLDELLIPIENVIRFHFIPAICDGRHCSDDERLLLSLPIKLGGLGIINVINESKYQFETSRAMTNQLCNRIVAQSEEDVNVAATRKILNERKSIRNGEQEIILKEIVAKFTPLQQKAIEISRSEGASAWLTTLP